MARRTWGPGLLDYCQTDRQREILEVVLSSKDQKEASKRLGIGTRSLENTIQTVRGHAARQGYAPECDMIATAPDGFHVKGVSTLYGPDGGINAQWVKTNIDHERQQKIMQEAAQALCDSIKPAKPQKPPSQKPSELLNCYIITDYHLGMLSWAEETGADWDIDIAEELLINWFTTAISQAPDAETGVFAQLGDFLHFDSLSAITPTSGHLLDADTRFQLLVRAAIRVIRQCITLLLKKHNFVHVIMAEGNHDMASSVWLRELFSALYADEPRVFIDLSPDPYYCYEHGKTSLFFHHQHKKKMEGLDDVFAAKFREIFGRTKYSFGHVGHLHHNKTLESNLMVIDQHRTLASPDAYASRGGFISGRDAKVVTYHKEYGKVGSLVISPEMVRDSVG